MVDTVGTYIREVKMHIRQLYYPKAVGSQKVGSFTSWKPNCVQPCVSMRTCLSPTNKSQAENISYCMSHLQNFPMMISQYPLICLGDRHDFVSPSCNGERAVFWVVIGWTYIHAVLRGLPKRPAILTGFPRAPSSPSQIGQGHFRRFFAKAYLHLHLFSHFR